jgi:hypothetical protein
MDEFGSETAVLTHDDGSQSGVRGFRHPVAGIAKLDYFLQFRREHIDEFV